MERILTSAVTTSASSHPNARRMYRRTKHRSETQMIANPTVTAETMKIARLWPTKGRVYSILTSRKRGTRLVNRFENHVLEQGGERPYAPLYNQKRGSRKENKGSDQQKVKSLSAGGTLSGNGAYRQQQPRLMCSWTGRRR